MVFRMQLTYDEIIEVLDLKYIPTKRIGFSLNPGTYEIGDINTTLKKFVRQCESKYYY